MGVCSFILVTIVEARNFLVRYFTTRPTPSLFFGYSRLSDKYMRSGHYYYYYYYSNYYYYYSIKKVYSTVTDSLANVYGDIDCSIDIHYLFFDGGYSLSFI